MLRRSCLAFCTRKETLSEYLTEASGPQKLGRSRFVDVIGIGTVAVQVEFDPFGVLRSQYKGSTGQDLEYTRSLLRRRYLLVRRRRLLAIAFMGMVEKKVRRMSSTSTSHVQRGRLFRVSVNLGEFNITLSTPCVRPLVPSKNIGRGPGSIIDTVIWPKTDRDSDLRNSVFATRLNSPGKSSMLIGGAASVQGTRSIP